MRCVLWFFLVALAWVYNQAGAQSLSSPQYWDSAFSKAGTPNGPVYALAEKDGILYVGGSFTHIGSLEAHNIASWDGKGWHALDTSYYRGSSGTIRAIVIDSSGNVYVGGEFQNIGFTFADNIAKYDGAKWSALGNGVNKAVWALAIRDSLLAAGGDFYWAGNSFADHIALFDLKRGIWSTLDTSHNFLLNGRVRALCFLSDQLIAGGEFVSEVDTTIKFIASWSNSKWYSSDLRLDGPVYTMDSYLDQVAIGGAFNKAMCFIDRFHRITFQSTISGTIYSIKARSSKTLAIGGKINLINRQRCGNLLLWSSDFIYDTIRRNYIPYAPSDTIFSIVSKDSILLTAGRFDSTYTHSENLAGYHSVTPKIIAVFEPIQFCVDTPGEGKLLVRISNDRGSTDTLICRAGYATSDLSGCQYCGGGSDEYQRLAPGQSMLVNGYYRIYSSDRPRGSNCQWSGRFVTYNNSDNWSYSTLVIPICSKPSPTRRLLTTSIDFGQGSAFTKLKTQVRVINISNSPVTINKFSCSENNEISDTTKHLILPEDSSVFSVTHTFGYGKDLPGKLEFGSITLYTNDSLATYSIPTTGRSISGLCIPDENTFDYQQVAINKDSLHSFRFRNSSPNLTATLYSIQLIDTVNFNIDPVWTLPTFLRPGEFFNIPVRFNTKDTNNQLAFLDVTASDGLHRITIHGKGSAPFLQYQIPKEANWIISPNPAKQFLTISAPEAISAVRVLDLLGRKLIDLHFPVAQKMIRLDVGTLNQGVYQLLIADALNRNIVQKIQIIH